MGIFHLTPNEMTSKWKTKNDVIPSLTRIEAMISSVLHFSSYDVPSEYKFCVIHRKDDFVTALEECRDLLREHLKDIEDEQE